ncbi:uncharacterized protein LOC125187054 [Salvia hispanica]|uniref:uncharacterized protein LOC125187054 n=1 Tax=Salvia hispanica TaxID=49212 RepID=UPI002009BBE9|nr:uncharacterized protein LOC125187054 [Salvia hispanica]
MLHKFCKTEAGKGTKSFLIEIKFNDGVIVPQLSKTRRLSIRSNIPSFISSKPLCPHTRPLFVFSEDQECLFIELISPEAFKLLRVLDAKRIIFLHIDSDMYYLLHMRYFALSSSMSVLPAHLSKLCNIQTLLVNTTSRTLDVKLDVLEFTQLRHFKTNASANLYKVGKPGKGGEKIRSLGTISPESCTKELFNRSRNLKKMGIRGKLSLLLEGRIISFDSLAELGCLEHLKLISDVYPILPSVGRLESLPPHNKFPQTLKSLTLAGTYLDWSQMSILALLEKLEVLKLKNKAFVGRIWETEEGGFQTLQVLHIEETK